MTVKNRSTKKTDLSSKTNLDTQVDTQTDRNNGKPYIGPRDEAPEYVKDLEEIITGYRINYTTNRDVLRSLFIMHNETINIWSHGLGFFVFVGILGYVITHLAPNSFHSYPQRDYVSRWTADFNQSLEKSRVLYDEFMLQRVADEINQNQNNNENNSTEIAILKSDWLLEWHDTEEAKMQYSYKASFYEAVETYVQSSIIAMTSQYEQLQRMDTSKADLVLEKTSSHVQHTVNSALEKSHQIIIQDEQDPNDHLPNVQFIQNLLGRVHDKMQTWIQDKTHAPSVESVNYTPRWPLFVHAFAAITMLWCSTQFHLFSCKCKDTRETLLKCDYSGIVIMIVGSSVPIMYYSNMCEQQNFYRECYLALILGSGLVALVAIMHPKYQGDDFKVMRSFLFALVGLSPSIPLLHMKYFVDPSHYTVPCIDEWLLGGAIYMIGAVLYGTKIPERLSPGTFDYIGQSHQIFHVLVLVAAVLHFNTSIKEFNKRQFDACIAPL